MNLPTKHHACRLACTLTCTATDTIVYRSHAGALYASVRQDGATQKNWSDIELTNIPNDDSNINGGQLPGGGVFLLANAVPHTIRDPLTVAFSRDGVDFDDCRVVQTCHNLTFYPSLHFPKDIKSVCGARNPVNKNVGPSYPQGVSVVEPAPKEVQGLYVVATNNKEDVIVTKVAWESIAVHLV